MTTARPGICRGALLVAVTAALLVAGADAARPDNPAAGAMIYTTGQSPSGQPIVASIGGEPVPATLLLCVNCHGADGRGRPEGGVVPTGITWLELTKPYRTTSVNGRRRPAYTAASLARAITTGVDPAGNTLDNTMPRFRMSAGDLADLTAYLKVIGADRVPGLSETTVHVATIVPDLSNSVGAEMAKVLEAYFAEQGKIHGRRIALQTVASPLDAGALDSAFAVVGGLIADESEVAPALERTGVPLILPITGKRDQSIENRQRFHLYPPLEDQLLGLFRFLKGIPPRVVVAARDSESESLVRRALDKLQGRTELLRVDTSRPEAAARLLAEGVNGSAIVFLDSSFDIRGLTEGRSFPEIRGPLLFAGNLLPLGFFKVARPLSARAVVVLTTAPEDLTQSGLAEYRSFAKRHGLAPQYPAAQLSAYTAAKIFIHALKRSGRDLTRETLLQSLERVYQFETGVTPPITFDRKRRTGSQRLHFAKIDPATAGFVMVGRSEAD